MQAIQDNTSFVCTKKGRWKLSCFQRSEAGTA